MSEERERPRSDWRAIGMCLLQVGALFVPIAICMLLLAGVQVHRPAAAGIDPVETGSVERR